MKITNITGLILAMFAFCNLSAQEDGQIKTMRSTTDPNQEIVSETTEKTYRIVLDDKVIQNSVKINTVKQQPVMPEKDDATIAGGNNKLAKEEIVKTVKIDNDADDEYDEKIRFRYSAHASSDFVMVTNGEEILIGLEDGENLKILDAQRILKNDAKDGVGSFIFTDQNGAEVEFIIDEYKALGKMEGM